MKFKFADNKLYVEDEEGCVAVNEHYLTKEDIGLCFTDSIMDELESYDLTMYRNNLYALKYRIKEYEAVIQTAEALKSIDVNLDKGVYHERVHI
ncbi:MAG: hypothetical protein MJZ34_14410 [Paludibacteraceae bacterium]|nr:hypothetical protein [Paludibacteraceae bacterium]